MKNFSSLHNANVVYMPILINRLKYNYPCITYFILYSPFKMHFKYQKSKHTIQRTLTLFFQKIYKSKNSSHIFSSFKIMLLFFNCQLVSNSCPKVYVFCKTSGHFCLFVLLWCKCVMSVYMCENNMKPGGAFRNAHM